MSGHSSRSAIRASLSPEDFVEKPDENYLSDMADEDMDEEYAMAASDFSGYDDFEDDEVDYETLESELSSFLSQYEGSGVTLGELKDAADEGGFKCLDGEHIEFLSYISDNGPSDDAVEGEDFTIDGMLDAIPAYIERCQDDDLRFNGSKANADDLRFNEADDAEASDNWEDDFEEEADDDDYYDEDSALESCDMNDTVTAGRRSTRGKAVLASSRRSTIRRAVRKFR